jgi:hypothetical protein
MHPLAADAQTILATVSRRGDLPDLVSVFTRTVHIGFLSQVILQNPMRRPTRGEPEMAFKH